MQLARTVTPHRALCGRAQLYKSKFGFGVTSAVSRIKYQVSRFPFHTDTKRSTQRSPPQPTMNCRLWCRVSDEFDVEGLANVRCQGFSAFIVRFHEPANRDGQGLWLDPALQARTGDSSPDAVRLKRGWFGAK